MGYKILVVDDERATVELLKGKLTQDGYDVSVAYDGKEALEKVDKDDPDIILLDLIMPQMNGFGVLREIRENHRDRWRPVIIVSAENELESVTECYDMEADLYLAKPINIIEIQAGIKKMVDLLALKENS